MHTKPGLLDLPFKKTKTSLTLPCVYNVCAALRRILRLLLYGYHVKDVLLDYLENGNAL